MGEALGMNLLQRNPQPRPEGEAPLRVGEWRVAVRANEIWRGAEKVRLEPNVMQVLCFLAQRPGSVVSREELEAAAWPRLVVTSDAVTGTIIKLRKALGDDARHARYIETISKSGYRLIAEVERGPRPPAASPVPSPAPLRPRLRASAAWLLVPVAVLAAARLSVIWTLGETPSPDPVADALILDQKPGIAVLPFENLGPAPEQDYFADGITEDLTTDLSKLSGLRVLARDSALTYKDSRGDARRIAEQIVAALAVEIAPADRCRLLRSHRADVSFRQGCMNSGPWPATVGAPYLVSWRPQDGAVTPRSRSRPAAGGSRQCLDALARHPAIGWAHSRSALVAGGGARRSPWGRPGLAAGLRAVEAPAGDDI